VVSIHFPVHKIGFSLRETFFELRGIQALDSYPSFHGLSIQFSGYLLLETVGDLHLVSLSKQNGPLGKSFETVEKEALTRQQR
jgi:hypothetical protein